jgi:Carbohydrate esterase, sialic acid-specific acetylesterase
MLVLLMTGFFLSLAVAIAEAKIAHFLFAGQSNMVGFVDRNVTGRFETTMSLLLSTGNDQLLISNLVNHLKTAISEPPTPIPVYEHEASELLRLRRAGYVTSEYKQPLPAVTCSFYELSHKVDYRVEGSQAWVKAVDAALSPYAKCGQIFGPEYMFGRVLAQDSRFPQPFSVIKVASPSSTIRNNWSKENGLIWPQLVAKIRNSIDTETDEWKGIVWFQGETDCRSKNNSLTYHEDLTNFLSNVRDEMHLVDSTTFDQPSDIPVVIVGLGCWAATNTSYGSIVMDAQRRFVSSTPNAVLVPTDDLSCDLHFDDASQLIIGARVANAMKTWVVLPTRSQPTGKSTKKQTSRSVEICRNMSWIRIIILYTLLQLP